MPEGGFEQEGRGKCAQPGGQDERGREEAEGCAQRSPERRKAKRPEREPQRRAQGEQQYLRRLEPEAAQHRAGHGQDEKGHDEGKEKGRPVKEVHGRALRQIHHVHRREKANSAEKRQYDGERRALAEVLPEGAEILPVRPAAAASHRLGHGVVERRRGRAYRHDAEAYDERHSAQRDEVYGCRPDGKAPVLHPSASLASSM